MPLRILFDPINREVKASKGDILLELMRENEIRIESICGGKRLCGKCKVILKEGRIERISEDGEKFLSTAELDEGYLLACNVRVMSDCIFTIPAESRIENPKILISAELVIDEPEPSCKKFLVEATNQTTSLLLPTRRIQLKDYNGLRPRVSDDIYELLDSIGENWPITATMSRTSGFPEIIDVSQGDRRENNYGLALDIGTTTIVGLLVDLNSGDILGQASEMNRQITYGEELVTRISYSKEPEGLERLQKIVVDSINHVIDSLVQEAEVEFRDINDVCAGGNTVMNHLFAGIESGYLELADVEVSREPIIRKVKDLGLKVNHEAYVYCLPNVSRFLGGDAIGDVLASNMHKSDDISLMVDLGTNGEIIFGNKDWLFSSSCASGPAFEGEGVRHGMRGAVGGIDHVNINQYTYEAEYSVIGDVPPKGICGSGLIDLVAEMWRVGIIDFVGKLVPGLTSRVREGKWGLEYLVVPAEKTSIGRDIVITQADLDYVIDSKAAACGAITVLMKKLKIDIYDVRHLYVAGAFGTYTDLRNATRLGIFPEFPDCEVHPIGNGSLSGAYATLMSMAKRKEARNIAERTVYIDLLIDVEFIDEYSMALYLPGAKEYFPSYSKEGYRRS